jgi:xylulokinase
MTRAVMEGVAFGLRDGLDLMVAAGVRAPRQIRASGGGVRSALWRQILADVLDAEIALVGTEEGAAYGASLLAAVGAGWFETVDQAAGKVIEVKPVATPSSDGEDYEAAHTRFTALYPALSPTFQTLT